MTQELDRNEAFIEVTPIDFCGIVRIDQSYQGCSNFTPVFLQSDYFKNLRDDQVFSKQTQTEGNIFGGTFPGS